MSDDATAAAAKAERSSAAYPAELWFTWLEWVTLSAVVLVVAKALDGSWLRVPVLLIFFCSVLVLSLHVWLHAFDERLVKRLPRLARWGVAAGLLAAVYASLYVATVAVALVTSDVMRQVVAAKHHAQPAQNAHHVLRVVDGDTFTIDYRDEGETKVRILGIDTPERGDPGYDEATAALKAMIEGKPVTLYYEGETRRDNFGRLLARIEVDGRDVGAALLESGQAKVWEGSVRPVR